MSAESIIKIQVDDKQFKDFVSIFEKYKKALADMPKAWTKSDKSAKEYAANSEKSLKNLTKNQKDFTKTLGEGAYVLKNISKTSSDIARNFASSALSVAKWLTYGALGGGFGLGALAASASSGRRQAQGLGISTGDLRATSVNFGKYIDAESTLSKIADIQNDLSRRQILTRLGGEQGQNAVEMLPAIIKNAISQFKAGGESSQYAEALGLTQILSLEELRRLSSLPARELQETITQFNKDRPALNVNDADSKVMQDFWVQLKRSGEQLETTFIKVLSPITPQLINLSQAITTAIANFLGSKEVKQALQDFTSWIGSDEAKSAIKDFISGIGTIAKLLVDIVKWVGGDAKNKVADTPAGKKADNGYTYKNGKIDLDNPDNYWGGKWLNFMNPNYQKAVEKSKIRIGKISSAMPENVQSAQRLQNLENQYGLPSGILDQVWKNESNRGQNMLSSAGAEGHFQFMPKTAKEFGLDDPYNFHSSSEVAAKKISGLLKRYDQDTGRALAAYNWGEGNLDKHLRGQRGYENLPNETSNYLSKFNIVVNNAAGADLVVSANAMR